MTKFMKAKAASLAAAAVVACAAASPALAGVNLLTNGGFESGFFLPGWVQFGDTTFTDVLCNIGPVTEGDCRAEFGPAVPGGISQTIAVNAGGYIIQFDVSYTNGSGAPNSFSAMFDGQTLLAQTDQSAGGFSHYSFIVDSASAHNASLVFTFENAASFTLLDGVNVQAPEPASLALLGLGLVGLGFSRRKLKN